MGHIRRSIWADSRYQTHQPTTIPAATAPTYYLVGSQAEADLIQGQPGTAARADQVVVITSADDEAAFHAAFADLDGIRAGLGLPSLTVVDLRSEPSGSGTRAATLYIVTDLDRSEAMQRTIDDEQRRSEYVTLAAMDEPSEMVVATTAARLGLAPTDVRVIDLRPQAAVAAEPDTMGGVAELIRDGGTPFSPTAPVSASPVADDHCGTVAGPTIC